MTRDEMRFLRRSRINAIMQAGFCSFAFISTFTRNWEVSNFGKELRVFL